MRAGQQPYGTKEGTAGPAVAARAGQQPGLTRKDPGDKVGLSQQNKAAGLAQAGAWPQGSW